MHVLVGTDSVHATAAICDYLEERATSDDGVTAVAAFSPGDETARRDGREALNVASVRLAALGTVETELRDGDPAPTLLEVAAEVDADEIVVGARGGDPDSERSVGSTTRALLEDASRPVVVLPMPELE
ncbi:universal stress protein [Natronococcus wangiae]|uniref:universal stress protein n=1 Tax=Natronococcus wangiae TaxID=3068275 RepID=UPI00273F0A90|nr:universal stress protein [Natronococcus sp. AD5]